MNVLHIAGIISFLTPSTQNQTLPILGDNYERTISPICVVYSEIPLLKLNVTGLIELDTYEWYRWNTMVYVTVLELAENDNLVAANYSCSALSHWDNKTLSSTLNMIKATEGMVLILKLIWHTIIPTLHTIILVLQF